MRFPDPLRRTLWGCLSLVWLASWIVPRPARRAWHNARRKQVWHWAHFLAETGQLTHDHKIVLAQHCWASFRDAWWLRFDRDRFLERAARIRGAPATCLAALGVALLAALLASGSFSSLHSMLSTA